ncbi:MAG: ABC transporter permease [Stackebrandtia sp.]
MTRDLSATSPASPSADDAPVKPSGLRATARLLRSELWLIASRRRNLIGLAVLCAIPAILAVAMLANNAAGSDKGTPPFMMDLYGNGFFVLLGALGLETMVFFPLAVAVLAADAISGEAQTGTLRYLLVAPVGRTKLLFVKFVAASTAVIVMVTAIAAVGAGVGLSLFGTGDLVTLSGMPIPFEESVVRLCWVCLYVMAILIALLAFALFVSTLTDQPMAGTIGTVGFVVVCQILSGVPQLNWLHPYLITTFLRSWGDLIRMPARTGAVESGLILAAGYTAFFLALAWARFTSKDVTS